MSETVTFMELPPPQGALKEARQAEAANSDGHRLLDLNGLPVESNRNIIPDHMRGMAETLTSLRVGSKVELNGRKWRKVQDYGKAWRDVATLKQYTTTGAILMSWEVA